MSPYAPWSAPTLAEALLWTERLVALAVAAQSLELLGSRASWGERGVWRWSILRREYAEMPAPLRGALDVALGERGFATLLGLRLGAAILLFALHGVGGPVGAAALASATAGFLALTTLLIALRWRGAYNGGSDSMTLFVLLGVALARADGPEPGALAAAAVHFVAAQLVLSYFVAGWARLRHAEWRGSAALGAILKLEAYPIPARARAWAGRPRLLSGLAVTVLIFECAFPLALLDARAAWAAGAVAMVFHLGNFAVFGLNRFVWAWLAAWPAVLHASGVVSAWLTRSY